MTKRIAIVDGPLLINEDSLSKAWAKAILHVLGHTGHEIAPLVLSFTGFDETGKTNEHAGVRAALDQLLSANDHRSVSDVAHTIFPQRIWQIAQGNRAYFYSLYQDVFPRYRAMNAKGNRRGLYFERLIDYKRGPNDGNQLEWILSQYNGRPGVRRSMFQASIFDPERDHIADAQLQFPCMQQISFEPTKDGLVVNAFYATQQLFVKAYGNYLGIAQLGAFMANEMNMKLSRVNVIVGVAKLERITKTNEALEPLIAECKKCIEGEILASDVEASEVGAVA